jgi:hypothetical protein
MLFGPARAFISKAPAADNLPNVIHAGVNTVSLHSLGTGFSLRPGAQDRTNTYLYIHTYVGVHTTRCFQRLVNSKFRYRVYIRFCTLS